MNEHKQEEIERVVAWLEELGHPVTHHVAKHTDSTMYSSGLVAMYDVDGGWMVRTQKGSIFDDVDIKVGELRAYLEPRFGRGPSYVWPDTPQVERAGFKMPTPQGKPELTQLERFPVVELEGHPRLVQRARLAAEGEEATRHVEVMFERFGGYWYARLYNAGLFAPSTGAGADAEGKQGWLRQLANNLVCNAQGVERAPHSWELAFVVDKSATVSSVDTRTLLPCQQMEPVFAQLRELAGAKGLCMELERAPNYVSLSVRWGSQRRTAQRPCDRWDESDLRMDYFEPTAERDGVWAVDGLWLNTPALLEHLRKL